MTDLKKSQCLPLFSSPNDPTVSMKEDVNTINAAHDGILKNSVIPAVSQKSILRLDMRWETITHCNIVPVWTRA